MDTKDKADTIVEWAEQNKKVKFDTSFIEDVLQYYAENCEFTDLQEMAIDNIYTKWKIDEWRSRQIKKRK